jgi:hypothetical protein
VRPAWRLQGSNKTKWRVIWRFCFEGRPKVYTMELVHSVLSGKKVISFENKVVFQSHMATMGEFSHRMTLGRYRLAIVITTTSAYELYIEGRSFQTLPSASLDMVDEWRARDEAASHSVPATVDFDEFTGGKKAVVRISPLKKTPKPDSGESFDGESSGAGGGSTAPPRTTDGGDFWGSDLASTFESSQPAGPTAVFDPFAEDDDDIAPGAADSVAVLNFAHDAPRAGAEDDKAFDSLFEGSARPPTVFDPFSAPSPQSSPPKPVSNNPFDDMAGAPMETLEASLVDLEDLTGERRAARSARAPTKPTTMGQLKATKRGSATQVVMKPTAPAAPVGFVPPPQTLMMHPPPFPGGGMMTAPPPSRGLDDLLREEPSPPPRPRMAPSRQPTATSTPFAGIDPFA